jgi:hypothetical protein
MCRSMRCAALGALHGVLARLFSGVLGAAPCCQGFRLVPWLSGQFWGGCASVWGPVLYEGIASALCSRLLRVAACDALGIAPGTGPCSTLPCPAAPRPRPSPALWRQSRGSYTGPGRHGFRKVALLIRRPALGLVAAAAGQAHGVGSGDAAGRRGTSPAATVPAVRAGPWKERACALLGYCPLLQSLALQPAGSWEWVLGSAVHSAQHVDPERRS